MKIKNFKLKINASNIFIGAILFSFVFFTFYDLNWGAPFYFHPDERNIASSISQLNLFSNMNPHFFAYGSLPIYSVYFLGVLLNLLVNRQINFNVTFQEALIMGRFISAVLTLALIFLTYKVTSRVAGRNAAIFSVIISATSTTYLQFSHFGTFEIWSAFFSLLMAYLFFLFLEKEKIVYFILGSAIFGIIAALKLSSIVLILIPLFSITVKLLNKEEKKLKIRKVFELFLFLICFSFTAYFFSSPFNLLDNASFISSMKYETGVATGFLPVFYTGSFYNTIPILFHLEKILPFLINPILTLLLLPAIFYSFFIFLKRKKTGIGIILLSFLILFISSSFLFAKWVRYIVPSIPFLYIIIAVFIFEIKKLISQTLFRILIAAIIITGLVYAFSFVKTVRLSPDTRLEARDFAIKNIPPRSYILSEVYDMGIVPFNNYLPNIVLFNFYELENDPNKKAELEAFLEKTDYIILPSQRILKSRIINNENFPNGNKFYSDLFSNKTGFKKIYETPCDIFCRIIYLGNPIFNIEDTSSVFDHPPVFIFKKR